MPLARSEDELADGEFGSQVFASLSCIAFRGTRTTGTTGLNGVFIPNPALVHDRVTSTCDDDVWR
jgi:hypothetical protein